MANIFIEIIGWAGMIMILGAYASLTAKKLSSDTKTYHALNLFGSLGVAINSIVNFAYPSAALNICFAAIATYGVIRGLGLFKK